MRPSTIVLHGQTEYYNDFEIGVAGQKTTFFCYVTDNREELSDDDIMRILELNHGESIFVKGLQVYRPEMTIEELHGV